MVALTRKQREIRERERQILKLARPIVVQEGYQALSMDRLANEMEYAKGTLYNHFPNKEEIVAALAIESMELRCRLFEFASTSLSGSRDRMSAIGSACEIYALEFASHFAVEQLLRFSVIWEKSSTRRHQLIKTCEYRAMSIVSGIVRDAVAAGDLVLPDQLSAEAFVFGFWSLTYGSHALIDSSPSLPDIGIADPVRTIRFHAWTLMNGYRWLPYVGFTETEAVMLDINQKVRVFGAHQLARSPLAYQ